MAQSVVIQVGQCGNQIGGRFWDLALREHAQHNRHGVYDEPLATFFRNVDSRYRPPLNLPVGDGSHRILGLKARGILIDMEEGVVNSFMNGPLRELFDASQCITSQSGSGNNWAVGHHVYGPSYRSHILESLRAEAEKCDSLESFFMVHSMGGGTGSGLGTYLSGLLQEEYPEVYRFQTVVFPSEEDDVVTSPYNSVLALQRLTETSDCVLPVENGALMDICGKQDAAGKLRAAVGCAGTRHIGAATTSPFKLHSNHQQKPFDQMNNIVSNLMLNLTSSMRFEGSLNVDINEITMNLVPFPSLKYLVSSMTPTTVATNAQVPHRHLDQMFADAFNKSTQLIKADPRRSTYLACALILRGDVEISDVRRNIERMRPTLNFVNWNREGWKTGMCSVPPAGQRRALLALANNTCIHRTFGNLQARFQKLYRKKANVHHYTRHMELADFDAAVESLERLREEYKALEAAEAKIAAESPPLTR